MTYREMLNDFNEQKKYQLLTLMVADEVDCVVENLKTDQEFNRICAIIENAYLHTEYFSLNQIAHTINNAINNDDETIDTLEDMSVWDILDKVNNLY